MEPSHNSTLMTIELIKIIIVLGLILDLVEIVSMFLKDLKIIYE